MWHRRKQDQELMIRRILTVRLQLKCDGTRWRTGGEVKGELTNAVGSKYPSHYLGTRCIQHYYRWYAHLGCQQSTELTPPRRFKWTRPFRAKDEIWFVRVCHHVSTDPYKSRKFVSCRQVSSELGSAHRTECQVAVRRWQSGSERRWRPLTASNACNNDTLSAFL
jgi:hypothetical protein